ncbi:helicase [Synechococcus phage S-CRM01]|uniref:DNA helicase n=1 Tax=Synechococcus phage S-CRM01 TaxID=1026955 RepID=UPI000209E359|nr:DNA helicase [Synechococcus phage S-CRM01]AEC52994.1 helicase [Synechococcus phage S-CRM01]
MTVILQKKNECEVFIDAPQHILYELQESFSFDVDGASFSPAYRKKYWDGKIRLVNITKQTIPAGLIYRLCKWLDKHQYEWEFKNNEFYGTPYEIDEKIHYEGVKLFMEKISTKTPREYQVQSVYQALKEYRKTILSPTASGKSLMIYSICRYMKTIGNRTLLVVPTKALVEQMTKDFEEYGWDTEENVHKIYEGHSIQTKAPVTISTWQSIYTLDKNWFRQFDCVVADECHQYKAKSIQGIIKKCPDAKWKYGFTGTLDGKNVNKLILEGLFGPIYTTTTYAELMENDFIAKLKVQIITLKHDYKKFNTYNDEIEYLFEHEGRNQFIVDLVQRLKGNVLILFSRVDGHGIPLEDKFKSVTNRPVHIIHGDVKVDVREEVRSIAESSDNNIILGSYGTMSTGVNIKNLHHVVFASPSKSRIRVLQTIGRGLRKGKNKERCMIYDIADDLRGHTQRNNYTLNHLIERINYYVNESFEYQMFELRVPDSQSDINTNTLFP